MIHVKQSEGIWTVTIDRPEKANSLTREMLVQIIEAAEAAERADAHAFILRGNGKVFSAGADLDEARAGLATDWVWEKLSGAISSLHCLTIAALNGTLAGGAIGMAVACDLRIAVPEAKIFYPVMKLGFLPQPSDPKRLANLVGPSRAKMILMAGQKITAQEALSWGLVDRIVAPEGFDAELETLVADVKVADPAHIASIKVLI
ncbi:enoyl-CoA hydratase [Rhodobacter sp. TJ_12]|uniref:enoyl-CoA hydratase/isomerase family protein n=1 Tax=Rhodobacter sp. TJ_12 TaxID=2029399 RepID=UPI001CBAD38F|nr:enoyl-CoA hydratase/isomerase family protein [Rhodobacter sp. TJ_12]MBZ4022104.1 enoyl-CoA hydratase [Rhodobacter sp. TJ_12]